MIKVDFIIWIWINDLSKAIDSLILLNEPKREEKRSWSLDELLTELLAFLKYTEKTFLFDFKFGTVFGGTRLSFEPE